jgi:hypothetical protein
MREMDMQPRMASLTPIQAYLNEARINLVATADIQTRNSGT